MYDKRGKNYCVDTIWGNSQLGKGSNKLVQVILNTHVNILFIPSYHSPEFPFPPPLDWYASKRTSKKTITEARIYHFLDASIVFYQYNEAIENPLLVQAGYYNSKNAFVKEMKLVCCLDSETFQKWTKMLRDSEIEILRRKAIKGSDSPYFPRYEDISDIEVYRFIHDKILEWKPLLSQQIIERLEL